jgi:hypothetical protein
MRSLIKVISIEVSLRHGTGISYSTSRFKTLGAVRIVAKYKYHDAGGAVMKSIEDQFPPFDPTITKKWEMKQGKRKLVLAGHNKGKNNPREQKRRRLVPSDHQESFNNLVIVQEARNIYP